MHAKVTVSPFQSTRPRGARPADAESYTVTDGVSIHAPAWGATADSVCATASPNEFQSTRPRGARRAIEQCSGKWNIRFNPRARVGRDSITTLFIVQSKVSIHAPAWGATLQRHCPVLWYERFNPRARVGRDVEVGESTAARILVSIHAPAWGATLMRLRRLSMHCSFQSTRPRGARPGSTVHTRTPSEFQSTRPRGARPAYDSASAASVIRFQSTRPRGARPVRPSPVQPPTLVSIHAPAWGATVIVSIAVYAIDVSIHAPAWGATIEMPPTRHNVAVSIHAPAWGATVMNASVSHSFAVSIHAPAWGATASRHDLLEGNMFQSTRPRGARRGYDEHELHNHASFNPRARVGRDRK